MRKHILLYTDNPAEGGVLQYNHSMICGLVAAGYQVTAVQVKQSNLLVRQQQKLGVKHIWLDFGLVTDFIRVLKDLKEPQKILSTTRPDFIIFSDGYPPANFAAKQVAIALGIPYITVLGVVEPFSKGFSMGDGVPYIDAMSYHYTKAKAVVAVSHNNLNLLHQIFKFPQEKGRVIHYGRPPQYFTLPSAETRHRLREEWEIPLDAVVCFTAARFSKFKGHQYQVEAIRQLKEHPLWSKLYFVWAGTGEGDYHNNEPEIKAAIQEMGVVDKVKFLGRRWDIPDLLDASDIFVLTTKMEGMPLSIMEGMAKGLAVIASAVSGIPEQLGNTGKLLPDPNVNPQANVRELVATLEAWLASPGLLSSVGMACRERSQKLFTEERMVGQYLDVVKQALLKEGQTDIYREKGFNGEEISLLESRVRYSSLVWEAWHQYVRGDLTGMAASLQDSLKNTPFLQTETILNWIENFTRFSSQKGEKMHVYKLSNSQEWQKLIKQLNLIN